jgi:hypothetical protein
MKMRSFEWDEDKRQEIIKNRELDILDAAQMFWNPESMEIWIDRRTPGEERFNAIGLVDGIWYELVYAQRGDAIRLITAWKLNEKSRRKSKARYARRAKGDEGKG